MAETVTLGLAASLLSSAAVGGVGLGTLLRSLVKKARVSGIVLTLGKTELCMNSSDSKVYFLDLDAHLFNADQDKFVLYQDNIPQFMMHFIKHAAQYVHGIAAAFPRKHIVVVTNYHDMLEELGIKKVRVYVPDGNLLRSLKLEPEVARAVEKRMVAHVSLGLKTRIFPSFENLATQIQRKFNLKPSLNL